VLESLGALIFKYRVRTLFVTGLALLLAIFSVIRGGPLTGGKIEGLEADRAQAWVDKLSGRPSDTTFLAVLRAPEGQPMAQEALVSAINNVLGRITQDPRVAAVLSPTDASSPLVEHLWNREAGSALALVTLKGEFPQALAAYAGVREQLLTGPLRVGLTGKVPFTYDLNETLEHDLLKAELISLPIALLLLLFVFRSVTAATLPVGVGALAVLSGIGIVVALAHHTEIAQYTINVCSLIGLGVAIDYSLFIVSRYREELAVDQNYERALVRAVATAGHVVLFSGLAVATGMSGLFFFHGSYLFAMGIGGAIVILLAVVFALTFLPALLAVLGPRINAGSLRPRATQPGESFWHRVTLFVMRRPLVTLLPTLGVLLLMGYPFLHLELVSADVRVLDRTVEARQGYELLREQFPGQAATRVEVAIEYPSGDALSPERLGALATWIEQIQELPGVVRVESVFDVVAPVAAMVSPGAPASPALLAGLLAAPPPPAAAMVNAGKRMFTQDQVMVLHVLSDQAPESESARHVVRTLRGQRAVGDGRAVVGGRTAGDLDSTEFMLSRAPFAIGTIVGVTLLVLFFLLRSIVLPLKAVAMNFLSIAGSFGALVWIFQDGHLFVTEPRPLEPTLPVLLFCIVFGLSMDYEVLMLSRMKEVYDETGDNTLAVAEGLEKSAGLITSAAAIMVAVFAAFALARVVLIQAVGVGMALAVTLDATLIRILLVPSTMRLFGELNWWAPKWMGGRGSKR
jgi:putative drug exporter of the RND superfamily